MPGGIGTLDEIFETAVQIQTGKMKNFPLVLMDKSYWEPMMTFMRDTLLAHATVDAADVTRSVLTDSPSEAVELIRAQAMKQFGLTYGPPPKRRWFLGER
jgi:hypothetical protein